MIALGEVPGVASGHGEREDGGVTRLPLCQRYVKVKGQRVPDGAGTQSKPTGHSTGLAVGYDHDVSAEPVPLCLDVDAASILDKGTDVLTITNISTGRSSGLGHSQVESRASDHRDLRLRSVQVNRRQPTPTHFDLAYTPLHDPKNA